VSDNGGVAKRDYFSTFLLQFCLILLVFLEFLIKSVVFFKSPTPLREVRARVDLT
jgi:hypothetical protein